MNTVDLEVQGMSCGACVKHVKEALQPLSGVSGVAVDLQSGHVKVSGDLQPSGVPLIAALGSAGYPAKLAASNVSIASPKKSAGGCCCG